MSTTPDTDTESPPEISPVAAAFRTAMVDALGEPPRPRHLVEEILTNHFGGVDPRTLPSVTEKYPSFFCLNLQAALDEFLGTDGRTYELFGFQLGFRAGTSLSRLLIEPSLNWAPIILGPVGWARVPSGDGETMSCLQNGLVLFEDAQGPGAIWMRYGPAVEVMHASGDRAAEILAMFRERGLALNPYRGKVIDVGFENDLRYPRRVRFLPRPAHTNAEDVILPRGLLEQIEEHTIDVVRARDALKRTGRHLKRGVLLHGRPGTGKTHTIRYLLSQIPDATVVIMSAEIAGDWRRMEILHQVIDIIQPGVVIFDDVDFIAESRSRPGLSGNRDSLFTLLDLLDGVNDDADLLFVLTTNRPNMIDPAVAARPGRIDQAIEVPLPDADCRLRLIERYARDLQLDATDEELADIVKRTDGVTASFVRELIRRAAAHFVLRDGVDNSGPIVLTGADLTNALDQLLDPDNPLTSLLLGAEPEHARTALRQITAPLPE